MVGPHVFVLALSPPLQLWQVVRFNHPPLPTAAILLQAQGRQEGGAGAIRGPPTPAAQ